LNHQSYKLGGIDGLGREIGATCREKEEGILVLASLERESLAHNE